MKDSNAKGNALRRILLVALLPLTILFWMTGWTLTRIGEPVKSTKPSQKVFKIHQDSNRFQKNLKHKMKIQSSQ